MVLNTPVSALWVSKRDAERRPFYQTTVDNSCVRGVQPFFARLLFCLFVSLFAYFPFASWFCFAYRKMAVVCDTSA